MVEDNENEEEKEEEEYIQANENLKIEHMGKKTKQNKKKNHLEDEDIYTYDELNKLILEDKEYIAKTIEMYDNIVEKPTDAEPFPIYYPKKINDITSLHGKIDVLPKRIGHESKKENKIKIQNVIEKEKSGSDK